MMALSLFPVVVWSGLAAAGPLDDPTEILNRRFAMASDSSVFLSSTYGSGPLTWVYDLRHMDGLNADDRATMERLLGRSALQAPDATWSTLGTDLQPGASLSLGKLVPAYNYGDEEPGMGSLRAGGSFRAFAPSSEFGLNVDGTLDAAPGVAAGIVVKEAWLGARTPGFEAGAGIRERWLGPGRHGSLMLSDNARVAPRVGISGEALPWRPLGRFRGELGVGMLDAPRTDVSRPGWILMDARWLPIPELEIGGSRVGIFGGVGRPPTPIGQLILPTEPHVYDDPNKVQADQDELAALDFRARLPLAKWAGRSPTARKVEDVDYVELYWQYGGEDVIKREVAGIPYPALAGVGNLYGAEVGAGPLQLTGEVTRVLDDYFRWYTGHRVYHEGFTQNGRVMGLWEGGDTLSSWGSVRYFPVDWGAEVTVERVVHVGVVDALGPNLLALSNDEHTWRFGAAGWLPSGDRNWWRLEVQVEQVTDRGFVPGQDETVWRVGLKR